MTAKYVIISKSGAIITGFDTLISANDAITYYEQTDKAKNMFTPGFYKATRAADTLLVLK